MDSLNFLNEINNSFTVLLNTTPFFHDSVTSWFIGICLTLSTLTLTGGLLCSTFGVVGMYEYYKDVQF